MYILLLGETKHGPLALDSALIQKISKLPFFKIETFLSWGNSNRSRTTPKFFSIFFFKIMVVRGLQSFCILMCTTNPLIEQWLKFNVNLFQTYDEQTLKISSQYLEWFQIYCHLTEKFWQLLACMRTK